MVYRGTAVTGRALPSCLPDICRRYMSDCFRRDNTDVHRVVSGIEVDFVMSLLLGSHAHRLSSEEAALTLAQKPSEETTTDYRPT